MSKASALHEQMGTRNILSYSKLHRMRSLNTNSSSPWGKVAIIKRRIPSHV